MKFEIKHRYDETVLFEIEIGSLRLAVEAAIKAKVSLRSANLSSADLRSADLSYADLSSANLSSANLSSANLSSANLSSADLSSANLSSANLSYADLRSADLSSADLKFTDDTVLPTGETWKEYLTETLPALLTAGGKTVESFEKAWTCHSWDNCPMAHAFDVHEVNKIPILHRPRAEQFIQLFDAKLIQWPLPTKESADVA